MYHGLQGGPDKARSCPSCRAGDVIGDYPRVRHENRCFIAGVINPIATAWQKCEEPRRLLLGELMLGRVPVAAKTTLLKRSQPSRLHQFWRHSPMSVFCPKWDGERCLAFRHGRTLSLFSCNRKPLNDKCPEIAAAPYHQKTTRQWRPQAWVTLPDPDSQFRRPWPAAPTATADQGWRHGTREDVPPQASITRLSKLPRKNERPFPKNTLRWNLLCATPAGCDAAIARLSCDSPCTVSACSSGANRRSNASVKIRIILQSAGRILPP